MGVVFLGVSSSVISAESSGARMERERAESPRRCKHRPRWPRAGGGVGDDTARSEPLPPSLDSSLEKMIRGCFFFPPVARCWVWECWRVVRRGLGVTKSPLVAIEL